ncbi:hypothetical protein GCM10023322_33700 [Rugosimonospora acidiphila]|uniref:BIG2 domain-containing protein n=1 Tax=Rugosimonospora acidiphila TaxID=556531 RepID=A0ABP9RTZ5_9ACTN
MPTILTRAKVILGVSALAVGLLAVPAFAKGHGTTFYVSPSGNDRNSGTSIKKSLRTIQRCADLALSGDTCEVLAGTYRETVNVPNSGTAGAPITIEAYRHQSVTVEGADPVTGWQQVSTADLTAVTGADARLTGSPFAAAVAAGEMYKAPLTIAPGLAGNQIFVNATAANEAQWPDPGADPLTPNVEYAVAGTTGVTVADPALTQPDGYWTGSQIQTRHWYVVQTQKVASSKVGSVALTTAPNLGVAAFQTGYYLYGSLEAFSAPNQWYYDPASGSLYFWSKTAPGNHISAKQRTYAFDLSYASHVVIQGFHVHGASITTGPSSTGDVLSGLNVTYVSAFDSAPVYTTGNNSTGIILNGTGNALKDSEIAFSAGNGVFQTGDSNTVTNNVIHDMSSMGTYTAGVTVFGEHQVTSHNTIYRVGHAGIQVESHLFPAGGPFNFRNNTISYNDISGFGRLIVDTGAIYVCCNLDMTGTSFDHNWVHDATPMALVDQYGMAGVYLDASSGQAKVWDNVGWNNGYLFGATVMMNSPGKGNKVYNNTGGVYAYNPPLDSGTEIINNIGANQAKTASNNVKVNNNLPTSVDPQYSDPAHQDFTLQAGSPARNAGVAISGITDGSTDAAPSIGAYQYGAPVWHPGASIKAKPFLVAAKVGTSAYTVAEGASLQTPLTTVASDGTSPAPDSVVYTPTDPSIATVDPDGTLHGLKAGATTVQARVTVGGHAAITQFMVTVMPANYSDPAGWTLRQLNTDEFGGPASGFVTEDNGAYTIVTTGWNIWSNDDRGSSLYQSVNATNVTMTETVDAKTPSAGIGPMIRDGAAGNAKEVNLRVQANNQIVMAYRSDLTLPGTTQVATTTAAVTPQQLQLVKTGNSFTGYYFANGTWNKVGTITDVMGKDLQVGTGVFSGLYGGGSGTVSDISVTSS